MKKKLSDFCGQVHKRPAVGYGADVTENSIAADSAFTMDRSRIRTETVWEPSAQAQREMKKAKRGDMNVGYPAPMSGGFVSRPVNVMEAVQRNMGRPCYKTAQKPFDEE